MAAKTYVCVFKCNDEVDAPPVPSSSKTACSLIDFMTKPLLRYLWRRSMFWRIDMYVVPQPQRADQQQCKLGRVGVVTEHGAKENAEDCKRDGSDAWIHEHDVMTVMR